MPGGGEARPALSGIPPLCQVTRPGTGEPRDGCGTTVRTWICTRDGTELTTPLGCGRRACPICYKTWAWREGRRAENRLNAGRRIWNLHASPRHVVVSFDDAEIATTEKAYDAGLRRAMNVLLSMGTLDGCEEDDVVRGGCIAYHPWRHEACTWFEGPHYHALFNGRINAEQRPPGVVVRTLRPKQKSLRKTWAYVVDHAGVWGNKHTTRWFGHFAYARFAAPKLRGPDAPDCPMCGRPMEPAEGLFDRTEWPFQVVR